MFRFSNFSILVTIFVFNYSEFISSNPIPKQEFRHQIEEEIEWLLDQLVQILSKFASEVETQPTLLESKVFRSVLVRALVRITTVIERIEVMPNMSNRISGTVTRLDAVRVKLTNFVSNYLTEPGVQSTTHIQIHRTTTTTAKPVTDFDEVMSILSEVMEKLQSINKNQN